MIAASAILAGGAVADASPSATTLPEIGVTYAFPSISRSCDFHLARGLLKTYDWSGVRRKAQLQLAAMRAAGIDSIRILMWHLSEPSGDDMLNLPSAGGRLVEPYRSNLRQYATDIRDAGFKSMVVEYSPQWTNSPFGEWGQNGLVRDTWDPSKFDENWSFIRDTRSLIKRYGPDETWFDPASEFAPTDYVSYVLGGRIDWYLAEMYRRYVAAFGKDDLVFFVIAKGLALYTEEEFRHLVAALNSTGYGLPLRFRAHPTQASPAALQNLRDTDAVMARLGLDQPLLIGELLAEGPNSAGMARDVAEFVKTSSRPVPEMYLWFTQSGSEPVNCLSAPYRGDSYISAFTGSSTPSTLTASVHGHALSFTTPYGQPVKALTTGDYRIEVTDSSIKGNFHLAGPGVNLRTGISSRTTHAWNVELRAGVYRFGSDGTPPGKKTLTVLTQN
jgi:hypothetical protein